MTDIHYGSSLFQLHHTYTEHPLDQEFAMHTHNCYEILYYLSGRVSFLVEGTVYPLDKGSLLLTRPSESHKLRILEDRPYERMVLHFWPAFLDKIDSGRELLRAFEEHPLGQNNLYTPARFASDLVYDNFSQIFQIAAEDGPTDLLVIAHLLPVLAALREASRTTKQEEAPQEQSVALTLVRYVNEHLYEDLSLSALSERFHFSKSQLTRQFRNATGSTLWNYILIKRLMQAQHLIQQGAAPGKASEQCGFQDYSSFYRAYKKRFHLSPEEDRGKKTVSSRDRNTSP